MSYLGLTSPVIAPGNGTVIPAALSQGGPSWDSSGNVTLTGNITLNNGAADGAQLTLASAGYSNWNIDNYSGRFRWYYNATEYMTLDTSGNLGLGVTPSAWGSPFTALDIGNSSFAQYNGATTIVGYNSYADKYKISSVGAGKYQITGSGHSWWTAASGTAGNAITFTQAMTLGVSGLLTLPALVSTYTTANAANMYANPADGAISRSTSALKYKQDIRDLEDIDINIFRPVRYKSKCDGDDQTKDYFGFIADEVDAAGIKELVSYGAEGEIESFQYERLTVVLVKAIQEQQALIASQSEIINAQQATLETLTSRIAALEAK